jgi:anti-sigma-K factor RskA
MKLSEPEVEARLRRTMQVIATTPLDDADSIWVLAPAHHRSRRALTAALAAAAVVAGVVAVDVAHRQPPAQPVGTVAASPGGAKSLADYLPTSDEATLLFRAEQRLLADCMRAAGQPFAEAGPDSGTLDPEWSRLGRTDAGRADSLGYGVPDGPGGANAAQAGLKTAPERDRWSQAFNGEPASGNPAGPSVPLFNPVTGAEVGSQTAGGCFGQAERTLYGDQSRHTSLASWVDNDVRGGVERRAAADPRLAAGIGAWSACMKALGYDYAEPTAPVQEFGTTPDEPAGREREVAKADVGCKEKVGLVETYRGLKTEYGREAASTYDTQLAEYRGIVDQAVRKANEILGAR